MRIWFNREKLTVINEPQTYLFRTTANICYGMLKHLIVEKKVLTVVHHESTYEENEVSESVRLCRLAADIQQAVQSLTPEQKRVYQMSREKGLKVPEIAEELSLSPNNIRGLLNSSIETIHDHLQEKGHSLQY